MSEQPPRSQSDKLDLILWRLQTIETHLDTKTVSRQEWQTHHLHLKERVTELEEEAERADADKKKIAIGVLIALAVPLGKWSLDLISLTT